MLTAYGSNTREPEVSPSHTPMLPILADELQEYFRSLSGETPSPMPFYADPMAVFGFSVPPTAAIKESFRFLIDPSGQNGSEVSRMAPPFTTAANTILPSPAGDQVDANTNIELNPYAGFHPSTLEPNHFQPFDYAGGPTGVDEPSARVPDMGQPNTFSPNGAFQTHLESTTSFSPGPQSVEGSGFYDDGSGSIFPNLQAKLREDVPFYGQMQDASGPFGLVTPWDDQQVSSDAIPGTYPHAQAPNYSPAHFQSHPGVAGVYNEMQWLAHIQSQQSLGYQHGGVNGIEEAGPWSPAGQRNRGFVPIREVSSSPTTSSPARDYTSSPSATAPSEASTPSGTEGGLNAQQSRIAKSGNGYGDDLEGRPPIGAKPPKGIQLSAIEILTFCPRWLHHPDVILRLFKAGWKREHISKAQLHATKSLDYPRMKRVAERVQKQISMAGKLKLGFDKTATWSNEMNLPRIPEYDDLTADKWGTRHEYDHSMPYIEWTDYKLADIAAPVKSNGNWPGPQDSLLFAQCLEYAHHNSELGLTTADCDRIVAEQGFKGPRKLDHTHDIQALKRLNDNVPTPAETADAKRAKQAIQRKSRAKAKKRARAGGRA